LQGIKEFSSMAPNLGTKRVCPKCDAKFYDFGVIDPIKCPKCGKTWTDSAKKKAVAKPLKEAKPIKPLKKRPADEDELLVEGELPEVEDADDIEPIEDEGVEMTSLEEVEEHEEEEESDPNSDDADDEMFAEMVGDEKLVDDLEDHLEDEEDEDEDEGEDDEDDEDKDEDDDDAPRKKKRRR
jgi:uncharacterized protein (TIGR02300 family)